MNDTTNSLTFQRQIGGNKGGRLVKSSISKTKTGRRNVSIPSKYTTTFIEKGRQKGFNSSTIRFNYLMEPGHDIPGPGNYNLYNQRLWSDNYASNSRKGYGGFVSSVSRKLNPEDFRNTGPGPGSYKPKNGCKFKNKKKSSQPNIMGKIRGSSLPLATRLRSEQSKSIFRKFKT
jgi:hypothetical protein